MADRILVTGANGFVGSGLCGRLLECGLVVRGTVRDQADVRRCGSSGTAVFEKIALHDASSEEEVKRALSNVQAVVHLAARVHVMTDRAPDPLQEFRRINVRWTERLARAAASQGVRRFVYLSSIKVNGEQTTMPFTEQTPPNPKDPYGISKWEAEQLLVRVSAETGLDTVVLRSPLVYGPEVEGNFLQLLKILHRGIPLPLAGVHNQRSLVYRGNLVDALIRCLQDRRAAGGLYLVSDGEDLSTPELIQRLGTAMGAQVRLWTLPTAWLCWMGRIAGKRGVIDRLVGSLQVDSSKIKRELGWRPPFTVDAGLSETAAWFRNRSLVSAGS